MNEREMVGGGLTWLDGTRELVASSGYVLGDLGASGLLRVGSDLLLSLLTETFAHGIRHDD